MNLAARCLRPSRSPHRAPCTRPGGMGRRPTPAPSLQAWFVVGTLSDMAVHALVLLALLAPELPPALRLLVA